PVEAYAAKVGTSPNNSLATLPAYTLAWDFREAMAQLVDAYADRVKPLVAGPRTIDVLLAGGYSHVISTVPLHVVYPDAECREVTVAGSQGTPEDLPEALSELHEHQVVYNLDPAVPWYRYSQIHGRAWTERTSGGDSPITKVLDNVDFRLPLRHR